MSEETGHNELKADVGGLNDRVDRLVDRIDDIDRRMHLFHEDVIARLAAKFEYRGPTRAEFAELKEMISRRLDPLEMTVCQHSVDIEGLKNSRG